MQAPNHIFSKQQWRELHSLLNELDDKQSLWLSGYLAATAIESTATENSTNLNIPLIAFGTETNNCKQLAYLFRDLCRKSGINVDVSDLSYIKPRALYKRDHFVVITSTHGDGAPPEPITPFYEALFSNDAPKLNNIKFSVLALGDSSYEKFCATGIQIDHRLEELGGHRFLPRQDCDVDYEESAKKWMASLLTLLPRSSKNASDKLHLNLPITPSECNKSNPVTLEVLSNLNLSSKSRKDPIHHLELAIGSNTISVEPGDAVGVYVANPPELVAALLDATGLSAEHPVTLDGHALQLVEALREHRDLTIPSLALLEYWSNLTNDTELTTIANSTKPDQRRYLRTIQVSDLIIKQPAHPDPQSLINTLRPLQPRLYDVSNSLSAIDDEIHLTVKMYRYPFGKRREEGIASRFLLELQPGDSITIYPHQNTRFHLPKDNTTPVILFAEGTGIAPYRAFIQKLSTLEQAPQCWLLFKEQHFEEDFLYQIDIQRAHINNVITHIDTVFYGDSCEATLHSIALKNEQRLMSWIDKGAHLYFCGKRATLEHCESQLKRHYDFCLGEGKWTSLSKSKRIHRNLY
ncbi:diflavin oxidoreductase [Zhongshania sp. BJYM1]|uniref:diflavin oxidoreductase n=1 Tax=Zhongshania aquatica TaxID=2965069 RepID=UPI0022B35090|nr:flavodoxin domain-containing protein [Marortus sp. BJYM1]